MGVADYRLSFTLPTRLQGDLPTPADLAREFPLMSMVKMRVEIEQQRRTIAASRGMSGRPAGIAPMLHELQRLGVLPESGQAFHETLRVLNQAAHGIDVGADAATAAVMAGSRFLDDLRGLEEP